MTATNPGRPCSLAKALQVVGEKWAMLAIREISLGNRRFDAIARNTGASRDILTARLRTLEAAGVIERRPYSDHPPRFEYHLTDAGHDLKPTLHALRTWGDTWLQDEPPILFEHVCGHNLEIVTSCRHCGEEVRDRDLRARVLSPGWDVRGPVNNP